MARRKPTHGGAREGAGRATRAKTTGKPFALRLSDEERVLCQRLSKLLKCSESDVLRAGLAMVAAAHGKPAR